MAPADARRGPCWKLRWANCCAATTRAATSSTTPSRRCTSRCAAPTPTPRCTGWRACSTAVPTRATWRAACCAWPARTSAWPTRARLRWRWMRPRSTSAWARPKANWRWPRPWSTWRWRPSPTPSTRPGTRCAPWSSRTARRPVPMHLRNAPTRLMKDLGHGAGYRYAHDEAGGFAAGEHYLPDGPARSRLLPAGARGLELRIGERLAELRRLNARGRRGRSGSGPARRTRAGCRTIAVRPVRQRENPPPTMRPLAMPARAGRPALD
jgi:hypothetical protein